LDINHGSDKVEANGYTYRAIATSLDSMSDAEIINWYNQRAEKSENKIKELMLDFGGAHMPCGQFEANALYFSICTLSYNLFIMLREHLPEKFKKNRAEAVRLRIYAMAAKLIKHSRQYKLKLQKSNNFCFVCFTLKNLVTVSYPDPNIKNTMIAQALIATHWFFIIFVLFSSVL
jgi:hypothetical protein